MLFQKFSAADNTHYFDYFAAFADRGQYSQDQKGLHYTFNGKLKLSTYPNEFTLIEAIDVNQPDSSTLFIHVKRSVPEAGAYYNVDDTYVLKQVSCQ